MGLDDMIFQLPSPFSHLPNSLNTALANCSQLYVLRLLVLRTLLPSRGRGKSRYQDKSSGRSTNDTYSTLRHLMITRLVRLAMQEETGIHTLYLSRVG